MPVPSLAAVKGNNRHKPQGLKPLHFLSSASRMSIYFMPWTKATTLSSLLNTLVVAVENSGSSGGNLSGAEELITGQYQVSCHLNHLRVTVSGEESSLGHVTEYRMHSRWEAPHTG
jgi:hypothetical protein